MKTKRAISHLEVHFVCHNFICIVLKVVQGQKRNTSSTPFQLQSTDISVDFSTESTYSTHDPNVFVCITCYRQLKYWKGLLQVTLLVDLINLLLKYWEQLYISIEHITGGRLLHYTKYSWNVTRTWLWWVLCYKDAIYIRDLRAVFCYKNESYKGLCGNLTVLFQKE